MKKLISFLFISAILLTACTTQNTSGYNKLTHLRYTVDYPAELTPNVSGKKITNDYVSFADANNQGQIMIGIREGNAKNYLGSELLAPVTFLDGEGEVYVNKSGYCDGPGCSGPFIAYVLYKGNHSYIIVFYNQTEETDVSRAVVNSFKLTQDEVPSSPITELKPIGLTKIKEEEGRVYYDGTITVSGIYREYSPQNLLGGNLCFYPDEETNDLIPREDGDKRNEWFCFEDQETAKKTFEINDKEIFADTSVECMQGEAVIEISTYVVDRREIETFDRANLEKIITKEPFKNTCS